MYQICQLEILSYFNSVISYTYVFSANTCTEFLFQQWYINTIKLIKFKNSLILYTQRIICIYTK